ncbi:hypothetical protein HTZ84_19745 [Haloterrigena sp. SYSU A558-1]|uniref:Secreted protein n=1 Tax=Haloterrigena gelatinilytica TaxID=2741724 RepID=A0ABX2LE22_9EURY|nr:hypothetical protein [Haloterrigena gelatinilytica]NUC74502.1 hypothetical protein [Haloterrigena gelatinilytica]
MIWPSSRRRFLSMATVAAVAGCLGRSSSESPESPDDETEDEPRDDRADDTDEDCEMETGEWIGEAAPIETAVERETVDDVEKACAGAAAEAAFDELNERTDLDLTDRSWIEHGWTNDGAYGARVTVVSERDRDGTVVRCPDPAFDVAAARAALPAEVTVTLHLDGADEPHECTHEIAFAALEAHRD